MRLRLTFPLTARDEVEALLSGGDKARIEESDLIGELWDRNTMHVSYMP